MTNVLSFASFANEPPYYRTYTICTVIGKGTLLVEDGKDGGGKY